tara:strand:+ start:102 stop:287 length:186 start_codon:yes stop_codon:yes gene_type:complete
MIKQVDVLVIHPAWMLAFIIGYAFAGYVFVKTDSLMFTGLTIWAWFSSVAFAIHYYYLGYV